MYYSLHIEFRLLVVNSCLLLQMRLRLLGRWKIVLESMQIVDGDGGGGGGAGKGLLSSRRKK